jgi:hypothetical protein
MGYKMKNFELGGNMPLPVDPDGKKKKEKERNKLLKKLLKKKKLEKTSRVPVEVKKELSPWEQVLQEQAFLEELKTLPLPNIPPKKDPYEGLSNADPEYMELKRKDRLKSKATMGPPSLEDLKKKAEESIGGKWGAMTQSAMDMVQKDNPLGTSMYMDAMSKEEPQAWEEFKSIYPEVGGKHQKDKEVRMNKGMTKSNMSVDDIMKLQYDAEMTDRVKQSFLKSGDKTMDRMIYPSGKNFTSKETYAHGGKMGYTTGGGLAAAGLTSDIANTLGIAGTGLGSVNSLSNVWKDKTSNVGQKIGNTLSAVGPLASMIPGVGPLVGVGAGLLGSAISGISGSVNEQSEYLQEKNNTNRFGAGMGFAMGGDLNSLSSQSVEVDADNPYMTDSVELPEANVDHGEVITGDNVFSDKIVNPQSGRTFAADEKMTQKNLGKFEKMKSASGDTEFQDDKYLKMNSKATFAKQEKLAQMLGLRNQDGTPVQSGGMAWGGKKPKYASGGKMNYNNGGPILPKEFKTNADVGKLVEYMFGENNADNIKKLQQSIIDQGYDLKGGADGMLGPATRGYFGTEEAQDFLVNAVGQPQGPLQVDQMGLGQSMELGTGRLPGLTSLAGEGDPYGLQGINDVALNDSKMLGYNEFKGMAGGIANADRDYLNMNIPTGGKEQQDIAFNNPGPITGIHQVNPNAFRLPENFQNLPPEQQGMALSQLGMITPSQGGDIENPSRTLGRYDVVENDTTGITTGITKGLGDGTGTDKNDPTKIGLFDHQKDTPWGTAGTNVGMASNIINMLGLKPELVKYERIGDRQITQSQLALQERLSGKQEAMRRAQGQGQLAMSQLTNRSLQSRNANLRNISQGVSQSQAQIAGQFGNQIAQQRERLGQVITGVEGANLKTRMYQDDINTRERDAVRTERMKMSNNIRKLLIEKQFAQNHYKRNQILEKLARTKDFKFDMSSPQGVQFIKALTTDPRTINID